MNRFTVEREDYGWIVCKDGEKVFGAVSAKWRADDQREKLERDAREKLRPCITCRKAFLSEGAHNRMCKSCRASAREIFDQAV